MIAFVVSALLAVALASADTIRLKSGSSVVGRILEEHEDWVRIDTGEATLSIPRRTIESVEKGDASVLFEREAEHALAEGRRLLQRGETARARQVFEQGLHALRQGMEEMESPPDSFLDLEKRLDAARIETLPRDADSQRAEQLYAQALVHIDHLQYRQANELLQEAEKLAPDRGDILLRLGDTARRLDVGSEAIRAYRRALELNPEIYYAEAGPPLHRLLYQRVQKLLGERRNEEAVDVYRDLMQVAGRAADRPGTLEEFLERRTEHATLSEDALLLNLYRHADDNDLIDLAFAAAKQVERHRPDDEMVRALVAESRFLSRFKSRIEAGRVEEAGILLVDTPEEIVGTSRIAEKVRRLAGEHASRIEAQALLAHARAAFESGDYARARTLASEFTRKHAASEGMPEAATLLKDAEFEGTVRQTLDTIEKHLDAGREEDAESEIALLYQYETIRESRQFARLETLEKRIPREREADEQWTLARAELDREEFAAAHARLERLEKHYAETRAGRRAAHWLREHRARLKRETTRYRPTDSDFMASLTDPTAWRSIARRTQQPAEAPSADLLAVPDSLRLVAWGAFEDIMARDLANIVDPRPKWLHIGLPLAGGGLLLFVVLLVFFRPGRGRFFEPQPTEETDGTGTEQAGHASKPKTAHSACRMCGQPVPTQASACPACGTLSTLTEIEAYRAYDASRLANLDPWEFRARPRNLTEFEPHFEQAKQLAEKGAINAAIEACRRALGEDPHRTAAYAFLAELYERQGYADEAQQCYREILLIDPTDVIARRKVDTRAHFADLPVEPGSVVIILSFLIWWFAYWAMQGLSPSAWILRGFLAAAGAGLTALLWKRRQGKKRVAVPAPHHHGAEMTTPLPKTTLSWKEQNRQARSIAHLLREHTGIPIPTLSSWRFLLTLLLSTLLLGALVAISWYEYAPYVLLAWPAGVALLIYVFEIHPRALTAHAFLRHLFEETFSPWADPHRPFQPTRGGKNAQGEFLVTSPQQFPVRGVLFPRPYSINRQGFLNSLQQALNRHWEFHRYYGNLRVVRDTVVPMAAGFRAVGGLAMTLVTAGVLASVLVGTSFHSARRYYHDAMTIGYQHLLDGNATTAKDYFQRAAAVDPERVAPPLYLAHAEAALGSEPGAERVFRIATALAHNIAAAHNDYGNFLQRHGRFREALEAYDRAYKIEPRNADVMSNIASAHFKLRNYSRAIDFLLAATNINPGHSRGFTTLGLALEALGETQRARRAYETALRVAPEHPYTQVARHRLEIDLAEEDLSPLRLEIAETTIPSTDAPTEIAEREPTEQAAADEVAAHEERTTGSETIPGGEAIDETTASESNKSSQLE